MQVCRSYLSSLGCSMGFETCQPEKYMGHMNNECYTNCPVFCAENEIHCSGGVDPYTGFFYFSSESKHSNS